MESQGAIASVLQSQMPKSDMKAGFVLNLSTAQMHMIEMSGFLIVDLDWTWMKTAGRGLRR